ncbi:hypothetical protein AB9K36_30380 [Klebsiella michiganensis]|uniref:hypothetical protein n=1 Tax=Klebsiella TaxID=570 RepID=UPI00024FEA2E|nr:MULTISPECIES: hypothetical protein [Klebsiella]EHT02722.1 hypothetical protein HMPREF9686_00745 [Klebsiella michiganensis]MBX4646443.1 hypothetical protein [Klebsiella michiganensis]MBZ7436605.1 hypothetical protein [Klebsiella michiganensis]MCZ9441776.1 hypothetical protein [Klebsiella michiganensis]MDL4449871.1 hypothetical protein [Klebsiella michiganensis]
MTSKFTREQLIEKLKHRIAVTEKYPHLEEAQIDSQIFKIALAAMDGEPVAYTDERNLGYIYRGRETAYLWGKQNSEAGDIPLYRHAQPAPVVPEEMTIRDACKFVQDMRLFDDVSVIVMRTWNACRAAMLNHPSSIQPNTGAAPGAEIKHPSSNSQVIGIDPASGPDRTVEVRYVAPPGYVMVPKEPTSEMVKKMRYHVGGYDRNIKEGYKAMLAAAPQEVNHG